MMSNGVGPPRASLGSTGDFYIDTRAHAIYGPKTKTGWGSAVSLVGPKGAPGRAGNPGVIPTAIDCGPL